MANIRQTNFSGGEISPYLYGRTDLPVFGSGLRTCKNFFISPHGAAVSRGGTTYIQESYGGALELRLVPFVYSDTESFMLEFGYGYFRVYSAGAYITHVPFVLAPTVFPTQMNFSQYGNALIVVSAHFPPIQITYDGSSWSMAYVTYGAVEGFGASFDLANIPNTADFPRLVDPYLADPTQASIFAPDSSHPRREWKWLWTAVMRNKETGVVVESSPGEINYYYDGDDASLQYSIAVGAGSGVVLYSDRPVTIRRHTPWSGFDDDPTPFLTTYDILSYNYYRGRGELFGFVGNTKDLDFVDVGEEPNYQIQPLFGTDPSPDSNPQAIGFFQERMFLAGTVERPQTLFGSNSGDIGGFDRHIVHVPGEAVEFDLLARHRTRIQHVLGARSLLAFTGTSVWSIAGEGGPLDFDNITPEIIDETGSTSVPPIIADGCALYVTSTARAVRALIPRAVGGGPAQYQPADISTVAQHLFVGGESSTTESTLPSAGRGREIISWCYAAEPWKLIWAVRADGVLLSCSFDASGRAAWSRHDVGGFVVAVSCVREVADSGVNSSVEDVVYIAVVRDTAPLVTASLLGPASIERMNSRVRTDSAETDAAVDCCKRFVHDPGDLTITGLAHLEGQNVYVVAVGNEPRGPYLVSAGAITMEEQLLTNIDDYCVCFVGLGFTCDLETLDVAQSEAQTRQKIVKVVHFEVDQAKGTQAGSDSDHLDDWQIRNVSDGYFTPAIASQLVSVPVSGTWAKAGRAFLRQTLPLPITVLGITREIEIGG